MFFISGVGFILLSLFGWNYYVKNIRDADVYQSLDEGLSEGMLRDVAMKLEMYRLIFGFYPSSIDDIRGGFSHVDPVLGLCECNSDYYYQRSDDSSTYFLFSKGRDCTAFTEDDLYPQLEDIEMKNIGFRIPQLSDHEKIKESCGK